MHKGLAVLLLGAVLALHPFVAEAYIGPGVGAGAIAAVLAVLGSVVLALFAVIYYPIKRMMKRRKDGTKTAAKDPKA